MPAALKTFGLSKQTLQDLIDSAFAQAELRVSALPYFGTFISNELKAADAAIDNNFPAIYAHIIAGELLTADTLVAAIEAYAPASAGILEALKPILEALIQAQLNAATKA